ncbi:MAG: hypothetical protein ABI639_06315 [Thermoanaerobaculia bacterium]
MKFVDASSLFEGEPAELAVLSTFQFDPDFFERRLLRCPALHSARRILVFMDAGEWRKLGKSEIAARSINRRYLVAPVRRPWGVFHPKLSLLVREDGGRVQCGSNNLTRSGCSSNLELLNAIEVDLKEGEQARVLARAAMDFFARACEETEEGIGAIAKSWLAEEVARTPWLTGTVAGKNERIQLAHTYEGSLWERLCSVFKSSKPKRLLVVSPFHDPDNALLGRFRREWPCCTIEIVVQQRTTNLRVRALREGKGLSLSELTHSSRRLHAKLLAWETANGSGCLVGSANFTSAAFDARNVEACLLISDAEKEVAALFDNSFKKRAIRFSAFERGEDDAPEALEEDEADFRVVSAVLAGDGVLRAVCRSRLNPRPSRLFLTLRASGESNARYRAPVPIAGGAVSLKLPESTLRDIPGMMMAGLEAEFSSGRLESQVVWVVQEDQLTHEVSGGSSPSARSRVEECGEGLRELLEELGRQGGVDAVIEYLRQHSIRFHDGSSRIGIGRRFRPRIHDPLRSDTNFLWLKDISGAKTVSEAIIEWVTRHERQRLRRHATRGNINGLENFIDVFTAMIGLLWDYHRRGVIPAPWLIGRICDYLRIATGGIEHDTDFCEGYLASVSANVRSASIVGEAMGEVNFVGHLFAALIVAQVTRFKVQEAQVVLSQTAPKVHPSQLLPTIVDAVRGCLRDLRIAEPEVSDVAVALGEYGVLTPQELQLYDRHADNLLGGERRRTLIG